MQAGAHNEFYFRSGDVNCRRKEVALMLQNSPLCEKQTTGTLSRMMMTEISELLGRDAKP